VPAIEITEHIMRDHMDMCRFTGLDDDEYRKIDAALRRMIMDVLQKPGQVQKLPISEENMWVLPDFLRSNLLDGQQLTIKNVHARHATS
jgi:hypothetical protein